MESVVEISHLKTTYGAHVIHDDISFRVFKGDIFALLGGSGSGKSTLLNTMIFLKEPAGGEVKILGKNIWKLNPKDSLDMKLNLGVLFQFGALFSSLNVLDNIMLTLREYTHFSPKDIQDLALMWLMRVGLEKEVANLYPNELSGGMVKRVGLARALALSPKILFLDEPTGALDEQTGRQVLDYIWKLHKELGFSIVMVTHNQNIAEMAHTVIRMNSGKIADIYTNETQKTAYEIGW